MVFLCNLPNIHCVSTRLVNIRASIHSTHTHPQFGEPSGWQTINQPFPRAHFQAKQRHQISFSEKTRYNKVIMQPFSKAYRWFSGFSITTS